MADYEATTWVEGEPPGISAAELQRMDDAIETLWYSTEGAIPIGTVLPFAGPSCPGGYLFCDNGEYSRETYADLFAVIGVLYGPGDGSTTFNVPDLRARFPIGKAATGDAGTLAASGGSLNHVHAVAGLGAHVHAISLVTGSHGHSAGSLTADSHGHSASGSAGAEASHTHAGTAHQHTAGTLAISAEASHTHGFSDGFTTSGPSGTTAAGYAGGLSIPSTSHTHTGTASGTTGAGSSHSHTLSGATTSAGGAAGGAGSSHTHSISVSVGGGSAGISGDVSSNTVTVSGDTGSAGSSGGDTDPADPPYLVLNYIIKT